MASLVRNIQLIRVINRLDEDDLVTGGLHDMSPPGYRVVMLRYGTNATIYYWFKAYHFICSCCCGYMWHFVAIEVTNENLIMF